MSSFCKLCKRTLLSMFQTNSYHMVCYHQKLIKKIMLHQTGNKKSGGILWNDVNIFSLIFSGLNIKSLSPLHHILSAGGGGKLFRNGWMKANKRSINLLQSLSWVYVFRDWIPNCLHHVFILHSELPEGFKNDKVKPLQKTAFYRTKRIRGQWC